jgi:hypothetical protein
MRLHGLHTSRRESLLLSSDLPPRHRRPVLTEPEQNPHLTGVMSRVLTESVDTVSSCIGGAPQSSNIHG